jgi:hypothetical protein
LAKALASSLLENPQARNANFKRVGLPDLDNRDPFIPPNLAAKETRLGFTPDLTGDLRLEPSVRL